jgi:hypothetical protein
MTDPDRLLPFYAAERDALEAAWIAQPPEPAVAFAEGDRQLGAWEKRVEAAVWGDPGRGDRRPGYVRSFWAKRDHRCGRLAEEPGVPPTHG